MDWSEFRVMWTSQHLYIDRDILKPEYHYIPLAGHSVLTPSQESAKALELQDLKTWSRYNGLADCRAYASAEESLSGEHGKLPLYDTRTLATSLLS